MVENNMTTEVNGRAITAETLYDECVARGIEIGNHESDLYIPATAETRQLCSIFGLTANTFINQAPPNVGELWLDVPFAYLPWWKSKDRLVGKQGHRSNNHLNEETMLFQKVSKLDPRAHAVTTTSGQMLNLLQIALLAHHIYIRFGRDMVEAARAYGRMLESDVDTQDFSDLVQLAMQETGKYIEQTRSMCGAPIEEYEPSPR